MEDSIKEIITNFEINYRTNSTVLLVSNQESYLDISIEGSIIIPDADLFDINGIYKICRSLKENKTSAILTSLYDFQDDISALNLTNHGCREELDYLADIIIFIKDGEMRIMRDRSQNIIINN